MISRNEPRHEKTNNVVSEHVRYKLSCTSTEDGLRLEILDLESRLSFLNDAAQIPSNHRLGSYPRI